MTDPYPYPSPHPATSTSTALLSPLLIHSQCALLCSALSARPRPQQHFRAAANKTSGAGNPALDSDATLRVGCMTLAI